MTSEQAVKKFYPDAEIKHKRVLNKTIYAVFPKPYASEKSILGEGFSASKAWVDACRKIDVVEINNTKEQTRKSL